MSADAIELAMRIELVPCSQAKTRLLCFLAWKYDAKRRHARPGFATIAEHLGVSSKTVQRHVKDLHDSGLIRAERDSRIAPYRYALPVLDLAEQFFAGGGEPPFKAKWRSARSDRGRHEALNDRTPRGSTRERTPTQKREDPPWSQREDPYSDLSGPPGGPTKTKTIKNENGQPSPAGADDSAADGTWRKERASALAAARVRRARNDESNGANHDDE